MKTQVLLLFDFLSIVYRWHHVMSKAPLMHNGVNTSAIHGFLHTSLNLIQRYQPTHLAVCAEGGGNFRRQKYPNYKGNRPERPEAIKIAEPIIETLCRLLKMPFVRVPGTEADDALGTLASLGERSGWRVYIVSGDKDISQLVSRKVIQVQPQFKGGYLELDEAQVRRKWGVPPEKLVEILALMGDSVDNIPGVRGIGDKTAKQLVQRFGSALTALRNSAEMPPAVHKKLQDGKDDLILSRWLVEIRRDLVEFMPPLAHLIWRPPLMVDVASALDQYGLNQVKEQLALLTPPPHGWAKKE